MLRSLPRRLVPIMHKRRLQQLSVVFAASAGMHLAVLGNLRPSQIESWTPRSQTAISVRTVPALSPAFLSDSESAVTGTEAKSAPPKIDKPSAPTQAPLTYLSAFVESDFALVESLTHRPAPASDVVIPYPPGADVLGKLSVYLTLFIDENGDVVRVATDVSDVPERFVETAKSAFRSALFSPGLNTNGAVKSQLRIEVTFDSAER